MADNAFSNNIQSLKELKAAYKAAMSDMAAGTAGATQRVEVLRNQLDDLQDQTQTLRGSGVEKLSASMGLMREAFTNADPGKLGLALKGLGMAMKAIPIFLIIEGIKYLVENFDKLTKSGGILGKIFSFIGDIVQALIQGFKDLTDWLGLTNNAIEDNAEKTIEAAKKTQEATTERYDSEIRMAKAAGKETFELEIKKQQAIIESARVQFEALKAVAAANGEVTEEQMEKVAALGAVIRKANEDIAITKIEHEKKTAEEAKKIGDEAAKLEDARAEKRKKALEDLRQVTAGIYAQIAEDKKAAEAKAQAEADAASDKEIEAILRQQEARRKLIYNENAKTYEGQLKNLEDNLKKQLSVEGISNSEKLLATQEYLTAKEKLEDDQAAKDQKKREEQQKTIIAGINSLASSINTILSAVADFNQAKADQAIKVNEEALETQLSALDVARDQELAKEGLTADQKLAIENKYKMQKYQLELIEYNNNTAIKKKAFEQDKKMKIAQAVISTITGAISAVTGMISAIPGPVGIILGAIAGIAVTAAGVLQVAKIKNTQFDAGSPPSPPTLSAPSMPSGAGSSSAAASPDFSIFDKKSTGNGQGNNQSSQSSMTVKAVVVAQEITDVQTQNAYSNTMGSL